MEPNRAARIQSNDDSSIARFGPDRDGATSTARIRGTGSMSWVTVIWSMIAAACLTLAAIYWLVWYRNRSAWAHLFFALTAASTPAFAFCELWLMRAETAANFSRAVTGRTCRSSVWLVSITWFVLVLPGRGTAMARLDDHRSARNRAAGQRADGADLGFRDDHQPAARPVSRRIRHDPRGVPESVRRRSPSSRRC